MWPGLPFPFDAISPPINPRSLYRHKNLAVQSSARLAAPTPVVVHLICWKLFGNNHVK